MVTIFEAAGGLAGLTRLAHAWHARAHADPVVGHAFSHGDLLDADGQRIAAYWAEALGGPARYSAEMGGESHALRRHAGNGVHPDFDAAGEALFDLAVDDCGYSGTLADTLKRYFRWANRAMTSYPHSVEDVPEGLPVPTWGWSGPEARQGA